MCIVAKSIKYVFCNSSTGQLSKYQLTSIFDISELIIDWFIKLNGLFTDNYEVSGVKPDKAEYSVCKQVIGSKAPK